MSPSDVVPDDFARDFRVLARDPAVLPVESTRLRLWCLLTAVQLASRHPDAMRTEPMRIAVEMARRIQALVATTPALERIAELGWDQTVFHVSSSPECRWCGRRSTYRADIAECYCPCCGGAMLLKGCEHRPAADYALAPWEVSPEERQMLAGGGA